MPSRKCRDDPLGDPARAGRPIKILFLSTNTDSRFYLQIEREYREIRDALRLSPLWASIALASEWAVRIDDLHRILLEHRPAIVHVAGHGETPGHQLIADRGGGLTTLPAAATAEMFRVLELPIVLVIFNACHSGEHARATVAHVPHAIGVDGAISDTAAIAFSAAFYRAVGFSRSVHSAFQIGANELAIRGLDSEGKPLLITGEGHDSEHPLALALAPAPALPLASSRSCPPRSWPPAPSSAIWTPSSSRSRTRTPAMVNLPGHSARLIGRDQELAAIERLLQAGREDRGRSAGAMVAVAGLPGAGKTDVAVHAAYRLAQADAFPGGIYSFDASDGDLTATWGQVVADALGLPDGPLTERADLAVRTLARSPEPVLLILDNVHSWTRRPAPLPQGPKVNILATTTRRQLGGRRFEHISLGALEPPFDRELLIAVAGRAIDSCHRLLDHLAGHTLAIELAGAFLGEFPDETADSYLAMLERDPDHAAARTRDEDASQRSLARAYGALWRGLDPRTREAWLLAGCFASEQSGVELAEKVGLDASARCRLRRFHLIEDVSGGRWRMHPLTKEFGGRIASLEAARAASERFVRGCERFARAMREPAGFRLYAVERTNLDAALALADARFAYRDPVGACLRGHLCAALHAMGEYRQAANLATRALAGTIRSVGADHPMTNRHRVDLARVMSELGHLGQSRHLLERAVEFARASHGADHPDVAEARAELAMVLRQQGRLQEAHGQLIQALDSDTRRLGADHPSVALRRGKLALVLKDLGRVGQARHHLELALEVELRQYGPEHIHVAARQANLATVLADMGAYEVAQSMLESALCVAMDHLGPGHPEVATYWCNLAMILRARGQPGEARILLEQALDAELRLHGNEHPTVAAVRSNLAMVLSDLGRHDAAVGLLERALETQLLLLGEDHPQVATCRSNLAMVLVSSGQIARARRLLEQSLAVGSCQLDDDHPDVAKRRANLGMILRQQGELERARSLIESALAAAVATFGEEHPTVATRQGNLAMVLHDLGHQARAIALLKQVIAADIRHHGEDHPYVAVSRSNLAMMLDGQGRPDLAHIILEGAMEPLLRHHGEEHELVSFLRRGLESVQLELDRATTLGP